MNEIRFGLMVKHADNVEEFIELARVSVDTAIIERIATCTIDSSKQKEAKP